LLRIISFLRVCGIMDKSLPGKKRKVWSDGGNAAVSVKAEADDDAVVVPVLAPPDISNLSPIAKFLGADLLTDNSNTVQSALNQLAKMCLDSNRESEENRATIHRLGGASILPGILRKWYMFPTIQVAGCGALMNASYTRNAHFRYSLKESGGLDAIVWAMKSYPDKLKVQTFACGALGYAIFGVKENAEYVVNTLNGIDLIVATMNKFPHDVRLQRYACGTLKLLTEWDEFKDSVKQSGGRRALVEAIENHKDESKEHVEILQENASRALKNVLP